MSARLSTSILALAALAAMLTALWMLGAAREGVTTQRLWIEETTPAVVYKPITPARGPVVVIAHGFAGSQQLMQSFAMALARNGYVAVTFDFPGHGRNPEPLAGSITEIDGATRTLVAATRRVADYARTLGDGRLAVLGHSMASDIVVRFAQGTPGVGAIIAVSMFSPAVTAASPPNLLVIVGDWEGSLKQEALRAVGLTTAPDQAVAGVTYGDFAAGTARRTAFSDGVEHIGVLYSQDSLREAVAWVDAAFGIARAEPATIESRGPWIVLLLAGAVLLAKPLSRLLPVVSQRRAGAGVGWRQLWIALIVPAIATPVLLRFLPTHFLPVLVADYLVVHFAAYGLITAGCLLWLGKSPGSTGSPPLPVRRLLTAGLAMVAFTGLAIVLPIDAFVTSFIPQSNRFGLILTMLAGTSAYFLADEWLTRGEEAARGAYLASKIAFVVSLALAVALDFERLFFLVIIVPVIAGFFLIYGLFSAWAYRRTQHPWVAGAANALAFAWAIGVTFPMLAG